MGNTSISYRSMVVGRGASTVSFEIGEIPPKDAARGVGVILTVAKPWVERASSHCWKTI